MKKRITLRFYIQKSVEYGGYLKVCGSVPGLGDWNLDKGITMLWSNKDWWCGEFQFEAISTLPKNNFKLETPSYHLHRNDQLNPFITNESSSGSHQIFDDFKSFKILSSQDHHHHGHSHSNSMSAIESYRDNNNNNVEEEEYEYEFVPFISNNINGFEDRDKDQVTHIMMKYKEISPNRNTSSEDLLSYTTSGSIATTPSSLADNEYIINSSSIESSLNSNTSYLSKFNNNITTPSTAINTHQNQQQYKLNNNQSLSPVLKGISPQFIDFEYKYIVFENYKNTWEQSRNHKVSLMLWSNQMNNINEEEEIFIELRDEWEGGSGIFPTLDFQSKLSNCTILNNNNNNINNNNNNDGDNDNLLVDNKPYSFLQPLDPHPIPVYPSQICTFIVMDEGNSEIHSVNLVSHFFGSESQKSIRMNPIAQAGYRGTTLWIGQVYAPQPMKFEYRYVVVSNNNSSIYWEKEIRTFSPSNTSHTLIVNNDGPLRMSDASESWIKTGLVGLVESNSNCPILVIVQLLYHIGPLRNRVIQLRGKIGFPITQCLGTIFTSMEMGFATTDINPLQFQLGCSIEDAAEVYNIILTSLLNEVTTISKNTLNSNLMINDLFEGELTQTIISISPSNNNDNTFDKNIEFHTEKFINLILPVKGFNSLEDSLSNWLHSTTIYQDSNHRFESIIHLKSLPTILIIQLDRTDYEFKKTIRVSNHFTFPKKLVINNNNDQSTNIQNINNNTINDNTTTTSTIYKLQGILTYYGTNSYYETGHFCYFVKKSKKWFKCDGSTITISSQEEAIFNTFSNSSAYILVYEKQQLTDQ